MIVKAHGKEFKVKDISYEERRELHRLNAVSFWSGKVDPDKYYDLLEKVATISGLTEEDFKGLSMTDIDIVLQEVFTKYMGMSKKVSGA